MGLTDAVLLQDILATGLGMSHFCEGGGLAMAGGRTGGAGEAAALAMVGGRTAGAGEGAALAVACDRTTGSGDGAGFTIAGARSGGSDGLDSTVAFDSETSGITAIRCATGSAEAGGIGASGNELGFINSARSPESAADPSMGADSRICSADMRIRDAPESIGITSAAGRSLERAGSGLTSSNRNSQATLSTVCGGTGRTPSE